ncbi:MULTISPECIES: hypothetical protein [unclassified Nocardia]|uniref:hypothetical protein n=1 Tax=unclassified Nocardia TaxID=2637762 RepID=UPI00339EA371
MIDRATARRRVGDWVGACAAAHVDIDIDLRALARTHGGELAARVRADLRHLAPDLLRWHLPRVAPDGLLRPGLTITLARYPSTETSGGSDGFVHLVVRTAPAWAEAGQRITLALWDGSGTSPHPHARPHRRFRLDLHRHLWDARRTGELPGRSGAGSGPAARWMPTGTTESTADNGPWTALESEGCAVGRWAAEAAILLRAERSPAGLVLVRYGARQRMVLDLSEEPAASGVLDAEPLPRIARNHTRGAESALPVLPDAATWILPDLLLLRAGAITADRLHPLVTAALDPDGRSVGPDRDPDAGGPRIVECRGARHRIGFVNGTLAALDHDPAEIRREELLVALTGTALPCLRAIDAAHRRPDRLAGIRERLDHGDTDGALAVVEGLLGAGAQLRDGPLRDELESAVRRRITYGLFRAGLSAPGHGLDRSAPRPRSARAAHPRHTRTS